MCTHPCSGGVGGVDRVIQDVGEKRQQVAEWLVGVVGDHDSVASLSDGRPAVTVCCGRRVILLPSAHLSMTTQRGVSFGESTRTRTRSIIITLITGNFNKASRADTQRQLLTFVYSEQRQIKTGFTEQRESRSGASSKLLQVSTGRAECIRIPLLPGSLGTT